MLFTNNGISSRITLVGVVDAVVVVDSKLVMEDANSEDVTVSVVSEKVVLVDIPGDVVDIEDKFDNIVRLLYGEVGDCEVIFSPSHVDVPGRFVLVECVCMGVEVLKEVVVFMAYDSRIRHFSS
eukprot:gene3961-biopygen6681